MLSKVSSATYTVTKYVYDYDGNITGNAGDTKDLASFTETKARDYNYDLTWHYPQVRISLYDGSTKIADTNNTNSKATGTFTSTVWNTIKLDAYFYQTGTWYTTNIKYKLRYTENYGQKITNSVIYCYPRELKTIIKGLFSILQYIVYYLCGNQIMYQLPFLI